MKSTSGKAIMISAKEARALYDASGAEAELYLLREVMPKIKAAAESGKLLVEILVKAVDIFDRCTPTPVMAQVMAKLKALGYIVKYDRYGDEYVPRALADDDGDDPNHRNCGLIIQW